MRIDSKKGEKEVEEGICVVAEERTTIGKGGNPTQVNTSSNC